MTTVAAIVAEHRDEIIERWTEEASRLASARGLERPELINIIPKYVAALAEETAASGKASAGRRKALIERHAAARLRQGFDVAEVAEELTLLGHTISSLWQGARASGQPSPEDAAAFYAEIQARAVEAIQLFRETLQRDGQAEKRYERQLRQIASEALHSPGGSLEKRLPEMLELVREAMGAQAAALLLYDPAADKLVTSAAAGAAREQLADLFSSLSLRSFAGQVAASGEEPTSVMDAETTSLELSEPLRHSGIHALLGVRLPPGHELLGVLYVGLSAAREFTARERYLIELLGERLVLHLENARLFAARAAQLEELQRERVLRERFVSVLAHDLRGPLSVAKLGAQLMMKSPGATKTVPGSMLRNLERMERMIRDLLDANRLRVGEPLRTSFEQIDFGDVARAVVSDLEEVYGERFSLSVRGSTSGFADVDLLHRALWNLAVNAVKYGAADRPIVIAVESDGARVRISVHNEGNPISATDQRTLFQPYRRIAGDQPSGQVGWGLGLALVSGAAIAHGGTVTVSSADQSGTTFTLDLPVDARSRVGDPAAQVASTH